MSLKGVDVSEHNGEVDYDYLISQGVQFSIVRFGFGTKRADYHYKANVENALARGLGVGAYWFIYALDIDGARRNAEMFCKLLEPYKGKLTYPVFADFEYDSEDYMEKNGVTPSASLNTAIVKTFCEVVESHGWYVGNYANPDFIYNHFDNSQLEHWDLWLAHWGVSSPSISCPMWQYGEDWDLDADICYVDYPSIIRQAGRNGFSADSASQEVPALLVSQKEIFAEVFEHMCTHDGDEGHGYSQIARWGDGTSESVTLSCGVTVEIPNGDFDCSSGIITALKVAGVDTGEASYTGNMRTELMKTGLFEWWPVGVAGKEATRGDIYLNEAHHTAMCTNDNPDMLCQFSISENGTIRGKQGDQTGNESNTREYYNYPWDGKLHWKTNGNQVPVENNLNDKTDEQLAKEVLEGIYGNGDNRKNALGDRYAAVQAIVNSLTTEDQPVIEVDIDDLAHRVLNGEFGDGDERKEKLGENYSTVQARVNEIVEAENRVKGGVYYCAVPALNIRTAPTIHSEAVAVYYKGQTVTLDKWYTIADGYVWGRYIGASSGQYRYVAVCKEDGADFLILA